MEQEQALLSSDLGGLAACVRKVRWTDGARERALAMAERLGELVTLPEGRPAILDLLANLEELSRSPESVRYSFAEQRRSVTSMSLPLALPLEENGASPISGGRELVLFLIGLVRKSLGAPPPVDGS